MHHRGGRLHRKVRPTPARAGGPGIECGCEMGRSATHHRPTTVPHCCSHLAKRLKSEGHYIVGCGEAQPADRTLAAPLRCRVTSRNAHCGLATNLFAWLPPACRLEAQRAHAGEHAWPVQGGGSGGDGSRCCVCLSVVGKPGSGATAWQQRQQSTPRRRSWAVAASAAATVSRCRPQQIPTSLPPPAPLP